MVSVFFYLRDPKLQYAYKMSSLLSYSHLSFVIFCLFFIWSS